MGIKGYLRRGLLLLVVCALAVVPVCGAEASYAPGTGTEELLEITHNGMKLSTDSKNPTVFGNLMFLTVHGLNTADKIIDIQAIIDGKWTRGGYLAEFDGNGEYNSIGSPFSGGEQKGTRITFALAIMDTQTEEVYSQTPTYYLEYAGDYFNINGDFNVVVKSIVLSKTELKIDLREGWSFDGGDFYLKRGNEIINCSTWWDDVNWMMNSYNMPYTLQEKAVYQLTLPSMLIHHMEGKDIYYSREFNVSLVVQGDGSIFNDVTPYYWAYDYIREMNARNIIIGYPEGDFRPNTLVTRSEFAKMMYLTLQIDRTRDYSGVIVDQPFFTDVTTVDWDYEYVKYVGRYMTGFQAPDGTVYFNGKQAAVREDMAVALVKAMGLSNQAVNEAELRTIFKDWGDISPNLQKYVLIAYKNGLIDGYPDGTFAPQKTITRAETCALLMKVWNSKAMEKVVFD